MNLNKHNGLNNNLKYHFYLFTGPEICIINLLFGLVIPLCSVWAIRNKCLSWDGGYFPFAESKIDEESKLQESIFLEPFFLIYKSVNWFWSMSTCNFTKYDVVPRWSLRTLTDQNDFWFQYDWQLSLKWVYRVKPCKNFTIKYNVILIFVFSLE